MKQRPGFITTQLHGGIAGSCVFLNDAVWESLEAFGIAFAQPDFRSRIAHYPGQHGRVAASIREGCRARNLRGMKGTCRGQTAELDAKGTGP
jgi:hypothetical protein